MKESHHARFDIEPGSLEDMTCSGRKTAQTGRTTLGHQQRINSRQLFGQGAESGIVEP